MNCSCLSVIGRSHLHSSYILGGWGAGGAICWASLGIRFSCGQCHGLARLCSGAGCICLQHEGHLLGSSAAFTT
eukprot:1147203-Pelagomonas_calceolata.AAC.4